MDVLDVVLHRNINDITCALIIENISDNEIIKSKRNASYHIFKEVFIDLFQMEKNDYKYIVNVGKTIRKKVLF